MLKIIIAAFGILFCSAIYGQGQPTIELNRERLSKDPHFKKKTFELPKSSNLQIEDVLKELNGIQDLPKDTAIYSHSTPNGMVYILPGGNMPMFKPNPGNQVMPGTAEIKNPFIPQAGQIPNGIQPRVMIFEKPPGK
jgi:hypothetical protein